MVPPWCTVDVCLSAQGCQFQHRLVRMNAWLEKKKPVTGKRRTVHTERQRSNARPYSQVISTVTGLVQDLLNISHFSNRTIFVGPEKKVKDRDVASWTWTWMVGIDFERLGNPACSYKDREIPLALKVWQISPFGGDLQMLPSRLCQPTDFTLSNLYDGDLKLGFFVCLFGLDFGFLRQGFSF